MLFARFLTIPFSKTWPGERIKAWNSIYRLASLRPPMESAGKLRYFRRPMIRRRFKKLKKVFLDTGREKMPLEVAGARFFKNLVIVKFKGIDNINEIEKYRQCALLVDREASGRSSGR